MKPSLRHHRYRYFRLALAIGLINLVMVSNSVYAADEKEDTTEHKKEASAPTPGQPAATPPAAPAAEKTPLDKAKAALTGENPNPKGALSELTKLGFEDAFKNLFAGDDNGNEKKLREELKNKKLEETQIDQLIEQLRKDKIKELTDAAEKNKSLTADQQKELYNAMKPAMDQLLNEEGKKALTKDPQKLAQLAKIYQEIQNKKGSLTKEDYERVAHAWGRFAGPEGRKWEEIGKLEPKEGDHFGKALKKLAQVKQNQITTGPAFEGNQAAEASRKDYFEKLAAIKSDNPALKTEALKWFKEQYSNDAHAMNFFLNETRKDTERGDHYAEIAMHLAPTSKEDGKGASVFSFGGNTVLKAKSAQELKLALRDAHESEALQKIHKFGEKFVASSADAGRVTGEKGQINLTKELKLERETALTAARNDHTNAKSNWDQAMKKSKSEDDELEAIQTTNKLLAAEKQLKQREAHDLEWKSAVADRKVARAEQRVQEAKKDVGDAESALGQAKDAVARAKEVRSDLKKVKEIPKKQKPAAAKAVAEKQTQMIVSTTDGVPFDSPQTIDAIAKTTDALHEFASTHSSPTATTEQIKGAGKQAKTAVKEQVAAFKEVQTTSEAALKAKQDEYAKEAERLARQQKRKAELAKRLTRAAQPK